MASSLPRITQQLFGDLAPDTNNFGQFGSLALNSPLFTKDLVKIQALSAFHNGWAGATVGNKSPSFEETNSLFLLIFSQIAYLLQKGIPEYDSGTTYFTNDVSRSGDQVFISKTDNNVGNPVSDTNNWRNQASAQLEFMYPVGEVYVTHRSGNPSTLLGFGTWSQIAEGQFPVMMSPGDPTFGAIGNTGGATSQTLTAAQMPAILSNLSHAVTDIPGTGGTGVAQAGTSASAYHNTGLFNGIGAQNPVPTLPPYNVIWSCWIRTA